MGIPGEGTNFPSHPTEEILEDYALDRLPETLAAQVEEHLLICPACQDKVSETDRFVAAMKSAGKQSLPRPFRWRHVPAPARASIILIPVLVVAGLLAFRKSPQESPVPVAVTISSVRGVGLLSPAPSGKALLLNIEMPDATPGKLYRVDIVDASGAIKWTGTAEGKTDGLSAPVSKPLGRGVHWVRLYGPDAEPIREFGLTSQ